MHSFIAEAAGELMPDRVIGSSVGAISFWIGRPHDAEDDGAKGVCKVQWPCIATE